MLTVSNINSFYGAAHILHDVSLTISQGEAVALLGRNGAGKSTVIARRGVGFVPEDRRIFVSLTVEENLEVGRRHAPMGREPWTREKLYSIFPNLAEMRGRLAAHMSGGEQQMLTVARTLMGNPSLILLDEPSEGLSPKIVEQVAQAIIHVTASGITVLLSEQNMHFASLVSERAYVIEKGQIKFSGTIDSLRSNDDIRRNYLAI